MNTNESVNEVGEQVNLWISEWINELREWMNWWMAWANQWINLWKSWANEWKNEWISEWSEWKNKSENRWINKRMEWFSVCPQEKAAKWWCADSQMDGLTTNGILVMRPQHGFTCESKAGSWREISVCGNVFTLRETRSAQKPGKLVRDWL